MTNAIQFRFDNDINGYIVTMPDFISLAALEQWIQSFTAELESMPSGQAFVLLLDTNQHQFESVQCLKRLREFLTAHPIIQSNLRQVAFVQPANYVEPHIKSAAEGYFASFDAAYQWLSETAQ